MTSLNKWPGRKRRGMNTRKIFPRRFKTWTGSLYLCVSLVLVKAPMARRARGAEKTASPKGTPKGTPITSSVASSIASPKSKPRTGFQPTGDPTPLTAGCGKWMRFVRHQPAPPSRRPRRSGMDRAGGARGLGSPGRPPCADKFPGGYGMVQVALGRWISLEWGEGQLPGFGARLSQSLSRSAKCGCGT